jgi:hypothetical protein
MRNNTLAFALVVASLAPGLAGAVAIDNVTADADCNSWTAEVAVSVRTGAMSAYMEYTVVLTDDAGLELDRFEYGDWVDVPAADSAVFTFGETWNVPLDAPGDMSAHFQLYDIFADGYNVTQQDLLQPVACGQEEPAPVVGADPCRYDLGYWREAEAWPADELELGGVAYDADELRALLNGPPRGDATVLLARQLIAAKLNAAGGAADVPADAIAAADDFLADYPPYSDPRRKERQPAMRLASALAAWNGSGCPDGVTPLLSTAADPDFGADKAAAEEVVNLGTLKSMFR